MRDCAEKHINGTEVHFQLAQIGTFKIILSPRAQ